MYLSLSQREEEMTNTTDYSVFIDVGHVIYDSSFVEYLAYDEQSQKAYVQLGNGTYVYDGVTREQFDDLYGADSVGHAFHEFARSHGPYSEFYDEVFYSYRPVEETPEPSVEENLFTLIPGERVDDEPSDDFGSLFSGLLPSEEEVAEANERRRREIALAAAATSVAGAKNPLSSSAVLARAEDFEGYLAGE
jgi:hypothetical protein